MGLGSVALTATVCGVVGALVGGIIGVRLGSKRLLKDQDLLDELQKKLEIEKCRKFNERRPKRIILIRHGQSEGNVNPLVYANTPDSQLNLTETGFDQALEAGRRLRQIVGDESVLFFVSPFRRSRQTFEAMSQAFDHDQYTLKEDPRIREQEFGNLQDDEFEAQKLARNHVGRFYYRFSTGESGADVYDRASSFIDTLFRDFERAKCPRNIVIVSHGLFNRLFLMRYFRWSVERFERVHNFDNCEHVTLELQPTGKYELTTELRMGASEQVSLVTAHVPLKLQSLQGGSYSARFGRPESSSQMTAPTESAESAQMASLLSEPVSCSNEEE